MKNSLFPSLNKLDDKEDLSKIQIKISDLDMFKTIEYSLSEIIEKIKNIDELSDESICKLLKYQHSMILNYDLFLKDRVSRAYAQKLFTNKRFLKILREYIGVLQLSRDEVICFNKIIYDYLIFEDKDNDILELLFEISYQVNNRLSLILSAKMGLERARILSIISNSSFKPEKNIHRINTFLVKSDMELTTQDVVDIYCILFDHFTYPIIYTMLETKPSNLNQRELNNFDAISLAIITLLNNMTMMDLEKVLTEYGYLVKLIKFNDGVRFSLKSVNSERIQTAISNVSFGAFSDIMIP